MYPVNYYPVMPVPPCFAMAYPPAPFPSDYDADEAYENSLYRSEEEEQKSEESSEEEARQFPSGTTPGPSGQHYPGYPGGGYPGTPGYPGYPGYPGQFPPRPGEIARIIERSDPTILRTMLSYRIPLPEARRLITRIVAETLRFCR